MLKPETTIEGIFVRIEVRRSAFSLLRRPTPTSNDTTAKQANSDSEKTALFNSGQILIPTITVFRRIQNSVSVSSHPGREMSSV
jgi:hypothetical protein